MDIRRREYKKDNSLKRPIIYRNVQMAICVFIFMDEFSCAILVAVK